MAKKVDPVKAKADRQKKIAIAGGVLLLGLLAFQVPRTMKMLHPSGNVTTSAATTAATTTPGSTPLAPPSLDGATAASSSAPSSSSSSSSVETSDDGVIDPSTPLPASSGQLVSFNRFESKDPFRQQIEDCGSGSCAGAGSAPGAGSTGSGGIGGGTGSVSPGGSGSTVSPGAAGPTATKVTKAKISVNGVASTVSVGAGFPSANPVFVLVGLTPKEAKIGISGGSLQGGAAAVTLRFGKTLTLQNTADGARYVLKLLRTA